MSDTPAFQNSSAGPFEVKGDHPTRLRADQTFVDGDEAIAYAQDLIRWGYENVYVKDQVGLIDFDRPEYLKVKTEELLGEIWKRGDLRKMAQFLTQSLPSHPTEKAPPMPKTLFTRP